MKAGVPVVPGTTEPLTDAAEARAIADRFGYPALRFEIREVQKNVFESWTASLVGRELAILVDGEIVTMPRVVSPLPGEGIIEFGAKHKSAAEVRALADRIRDQSEKKQGG